MFHNVHDFEVDDAFYAVAGDGVWKPLDMTSTTGAQVASGVLYADTYGVITTSTTASVYASVAANGTCVIIKDNLAGFASGETDMNKAIVYGQLQKKGFLLREAY